MVEDSQTNKFDQMAVHLGTDRNDRGSRILGAGQS